MLGGIWWTYSSLCRNIYIMYFKNWPPQNCECGYVCSWLLQNPSTSNLPPPHSVIGACLSSSSVAVCVSPLGRQFLVWRNAKICLSGRESRTAAESMGNPVENSRGREPVSWKFKLKRTWTMYHGKSLGVEYAKVIVCIMNLDLVNVHLLNVINWGIMNKWGMKTEWISPVWKELLGLKFRGPLIKLCFCCMSYETLIFPCLFYILLLTLKSFLPLCHSQEPKKQLHVFQSPHREYKKAPGLSYTMWCPQ